MSTRLECGLRLGSRSIYLRKFGGDHDGQVLTYPSVYPDGREAVKFLGL